VWLWTASTAVNRAEALRALQRVLEINPHNAKALQWIERLRPSAPTPVEEPKPAPVSLRPEPKPLAPAARPPEKDDPVRTVLVEKSRPAGTPPEAAPEPA